MVRPADVAWLILVSAIVGYEVACPRDELLSRAWDRYLELWPILARLVPVIVALHLINVLPRWCDPLALMSSYDVRLLSR